MWTATSPTCPDPTYRCVSSSWSGPTNVTNEENHHQRSWLQLWKGGRHDRRVKTVACPPRKGSIKQDQGRIKKISGRKQKIEERQKGKRWIANTREQFPSLIYIYIYIKGKKEREEEEEEEEKRGLLLYIEISASCRFLFWFGFFFLFPFFSYFALLFSSLISFSVLISTVQYTILFATTSAWMYSR